ncbi:hypothetical protein PR048_011201 [Dryococelus australis]|uniref:Uncharacterized protein n=1 Tax=Dryococelus australis TaxID=614101 RepID=A0ABQ9HL36_9NEOP|nr:hypothetical protein PR048_011201 [Dryococelus australis]
MTDWCPVVGQSVRERQTQGGGSVTHGPSTPSVPAVLVCTHGNKWVMVGGDVNQQCKPPLPPAGVWSGLWLLHEHSGSLQLWHWPNSFVLFSTSAMAAALDEVKRGVAVKTAASKYDVLKTTLLQISCFSKEWTSHAFLFRRRETSSDMIETMAKADFPITKDNFMSSVAQLASNFNKEFKSHKPSRKWYDCILRRNQQVALRTPQNLTESNSDVTSLQLHDWFKEVELFLSENNVDSVIREPQQNFKSR